MSGISKRVSGLWVSGDYGIMKTATDTITTLPANLYADGNNATVGISGNMEQNGTPTPDNPIQPSECGDLETVGEKAGQYKIPISSAGQTTPVYLGEVESTRRIKKFTFTGTENGWNISQDGRFWIGFGGYKKSGNVIYCTHYVGIENQEDTSSVGKGQICFYSSSTNRMIVYDNAYATVNAFKTYLQQQYANGTPVTVWYVLATEETGIVNEPIRKIGDYADTVSGITIPTIAGANSFDVLTTLKPSEVSLSYTGWHDASVKEKSENYLDENDFGLVEVAAGVYRTGTDVGVLPSGTYTLSANKSSSAVQIYRTTKNGSTYNYETISELPYTFTADGVSNQIFRTAGSTETSWADAGYSNVMLNTGETAQTYEPYWK